MTKSKVVILFLVISNSYTGVNAQKESLSFESGFSANYTTQFFNRNTFGRPGYGIFFHCVGYSIEKPTFVCGIEYSSTRQFKSRYNSTSKYSSHIYNATVYLENITLPLMVRVRQNNIFLDLGLYFQGIFFPRVKGEIHSWTSYTMEIKKAERELRIKQANIGGVLGVGLKKELGNHTFFLRADWKIGLNNLDDYYNNKLYNSYASLSLGMQL